jgi:hypothetical protein
LLFKAAWPIFAPRFIEVLRSYSLIIKMNLKDGAVAQLVEQRTENPCVPGSSPGGATNPEQLFGVFYCINILVSKRNLYLYTKNINYEKNIISSSYNAYLHYEFRTKCYTALLLNSRL